MSTGVVVYMVCEPITGPGIGIGRMGSKLLVLFICYSGLFSDFFISKFLTSIKQKIYFYIYFLDTCL